MFKIGLIFPAILNSEYLLAAIEYSFIIGTNTPRQFKQYTSSNTNKFKQILCGYPLLPDNRPNYIHMYREISQILSNGGQKTKY